MNVKEKSEYQQLVFALYLYYNKINCILAFL